MEKLPFNHDAEDIGKAINLDLDTFYDLIEDYLKTKIIDNASKLRAISYLLTTHELELEPVAVALCFLDFDSKSEVVEFIENKIEKLNSDTLYKIVNYAVNHISEFVEAKNELEE